MLSFIRRHLWCQFTNLKACHSCRVLTWCTIREAAALTAVLLLPTATNLGHRAIVHSVADLRLVQARLLVRAKERWSGAVDRSWTIPLVPRLWLGCHLWYLVTELNDLSDLHVDLCIYITVQKKVKYCLSFWSPPWGSPPCRRTSALGRSGARCQGRRSACLLGSRLAVEVVVEARQVRREAP